MSTFVKLSIPLLALFSAACSAQSQPMTIREFAERDTRSIDTTVYKQVDGQSLRMLSCKPDGWGTGQKRPAMVWIHGGGWVAGEPENMIPQIKYSAARGAVGLAIQYPLMIPQNYKDDKALSDAENAVAREAQRQAFIDGPSLRDCIDDCEDAIRTIRRNADALGVDPDRIIVIGDSAGAYLAASLGTLVADDARANAVIACSSISDLTSGFGPDYVKPVGTDHDTPQAADAARMQRAKSLSPLFNITDSAPPFLILAGEKDWLKDEPKTFFDALQAAGIDSAFKLYPEAKHAFIVYGYSATLEEITQTILDLDAFLLERGLLDGPTAIQMPTYPESGKTIATIDAAFTGPKTLEAPGDFPGTLTLSMEVKPNKKFNGTLFELPGKFGCKYSIRNGSHEFNALRMRERGKQIQFEPDVWNRVEIAMGRDQVRIQVGDQVTEVPNTVHHGFVANQIIFGDRLDAEIRKVQITNGASPKQ